jgi:hypothetical protein
MLDNMFLRYNGHKHNCHCRVDVRPHVTSFVDDSLFYVWQAQRGYTFYICDRLLFEEVGDPPTRTCVAMRATQLETHGFDLHGLNMAKVGVHHDFGRSTVVVERMPLDRWTGKAMRVGQIIMTVPDGCIEEII